MTLLDSKRHGIIDYIVVIALWSSPGLFNFPTATSLFLYGLGILHLLLTVFTSFECGVNRLIPLKVHGWIEFAVSFALIGLSFYYGSLDGNFPRFFIIGLGLSVFAVWALSDYRCSASPK